MIQINLQNQKIGGLWASRIDAEFGWKDWCKDEKFNLDSFNVNFKFKIKPDSRVLVIRNISDIEKYLSHKLYHNIICNIDFEKIISDGYDAIELIHGDNYMELHFGVFNAWDCDSIVILNKDIIIPI